MARVTGHGYVLTTATANREGLDAEGRVEQDYDEGRHMQSRTQAHTVCKWGKGFRSRKRYGLEHKMTGTSIICHASIRGWSMIHSSNESCQRCRLPLIKTSQTSQLDSKQKHESDEQQR